MRILALLHAYIPRHNAGAELMIHAMLAALVADGHDVDVLITRDCPDRYIRDGVVVQAAPATAAGLARWARESDVIVTHLENTPGATLLGELHGVPVVHVLHNTFPPPRRIVDRAALAVFNSQWMARAYADVKVRRGIVVRPPVNAGDYATTPGDHITIINLYRRKGSGVFWALAERMPDLSFLAVRGGYGEQDIRSLPNVEVVDHVPAEAMRGEVYARTRILLMPSVYESWGRTAIEAGASGIPTIAHPTPGLMESLDYAGIWADRGDVDAWEEHIRRLAAPSVWRQAGILAARRAFQLDPAEDLAGWCTAIREVGRAARSLQTQP